MIRKCYLQSFRCKYKVRRDVPCRNAPLLFSLGREAIECSGGNIIFGVGHEDLFGIGIHSQSIRYLDTLFRTVRNEVRSHYTFLPRVINAITNGILPGVLTILRTLIEERVPTQTKLTGRKVQHISHHIIMRVYDIYLGVYVVIITT